MKQTSTKTGLNAKPIWGPARRIDMKIIAELQSETPSSSSKASASSSSPEQQKPACHDNEQKRDNKQNQKHDNGQK